MDSTRRFLARAAVALLLIASVPGLSLAQPSSPGTHGCGASITEPGQARQTVQALVDWATEKLPRQYEGEKDWDDRKKLWAGVRVRRDGLKLKTKRRWRQVRHGLQTKYRVRFPGDPSARPPIGVRIIAVRHQAADAGQPGGWEIECEASSPLDFSARVERWNLGVQWYSVEISGHMRVRLTMSATVSAYPDFSEIPPAVVIGPRVTAAAVSLEELNVDRISKVGGEVAEQWGDLAKKIAEEIFIDELNGSLAEKMNRSIEKNHDDLRLSAADWWGRLSRPAESD